MSDTLRLLVHELVVEFETRCDSSCPKPCRTSRNGSHVHPGLWYLLAVQTEPVHMDSADGSGHRKVSGSPMSTDPAVTFWLSDVATGVRVLEESLRAVAHTCERPRGGSDLNTIRSLQNIASLSATVEAMLPGNPWPARAEDQVAKWVREARQILGVDQKPIPLPQVPCPAEYEDGSVCGCFTLRQIPSDGRITCLTCRTTWDSAAWLGQIVEAS